MTITPNLTNRLAEFCPATDRDILYGRVLAFCATVAKKKLATFDFIDPVVSVQDVAQHSAMNAFRFMDRFAASTQSFKVWLAWRVHNVIRDIILGTRKMKRSRRALTNIRGLNNARDPRPLCPHRQPDVWRRLASILNERERRLVALRFEENLTAPEIAERTGTTRKNARSVLAFAMRKLRDHRHEVRAALAS